MNWKTGLILSMVEELGELHRADGVRDVNDALVDIYTTATLGALVCSADAWTAAVADAHASAIMRGASAEDVHERFHAARGLLRTLEQFPAHSTTALRTLETRAIAYGRSAAQSTSVAASLGMRDRAERKR
jgi:hypothetical protein